MVRLSNLKRITLGENGIDCIFVGYAKDSKTYRFYVIEPNEYVFINSIIQSRDAIFDENRFSSIPRPKDVIPNSVKSQKDDHSDDVPSETHEPHKGFRQKEGIDYFDTYAPVARITIIRLLLALAAIHNLVIHQMDVKIAFLNIDLEEEEEVYMKQPKGFIMPVGRLSRFTSNPSRQHWRAITRVFKYLKYTMNYGLSYVGYPSVLKDYSYASWINHVEDSSSTSGWVFLLGRGTISWAFKKQTYITGSTMESEFLALAVTGKEAE
ncbi:zinc finger, CCHC-type containing protein [Tanacetum coccineum]